MHCQNNVVVASKNEFVEKVERSESWLVYRPVRLFMRMFNFTD